MYSHLHCVVCVWMALKQASKPNARWAYCGRLSANFVRYCSGARNGLNEVSARRRRRRLSAPHRRRRRSHVADQHVAIWMLSLVCSHLKCTRTHNRLLISRHTSFIRVMCTVECECAFFKESCPGGFVCVCVCDNQKAIILSNLCCENIVGLFLCC